MAVSCKKQKTATCLALIAIIMLCLFCSFFVVLNAETKENSSIKVVHISDLHYYPTYLSYGQNNADYFDSAMYKKSALESKLVIESSAVLKKMFADILKMSEIQSANEQTKDNLLDYLLVTGDLSSDGERVALVDIANALRDLQNKMRTVNPNFQVFVIPGNHDISNKNATDYSKVEGEQIQSVTRLEFARIFAGLGYPDMDDEEAKIFFANDIVADENLKFLPYDAEDGKFVQSKNAGNIKFERIVKNLAGSELADGELTYVAKCPNGTTIVAIDGVSSGSVGGTVGQNVFDWLASKNAKNENIMEGDNLISLSHHNVLPHFTMQENYTKNYLFANWEKTRDFLLKHNVKYNFSGHMHANDVAAYCDSDGYNLYDIETGSPVGCGAAYREANITFFANGDSDMFQTPRTIRNVDVDLLMQNGYLTVNRNVSYKSQINSKNMIENLSEYIDERLYDSMLDNVLDSAILLVSKENFVDYLIKYAEKQLSQSQLLAKFFADNVDALKIVFGNFYDQIQTKSLANFAYEGDKTILQGPENKLRAYIYNFAKSVIDIEITSGYTVQNMFVDAYTTHLKGGEDKEIAGGTNIGRALEWMQSGDLVRSVVARLKDENTGLIGLIKKVLVENFDLTKSLTADKLTAEQIRELNIILAPYSCRLESFSLDKFIKNFADDKLAQMPSDLLENKVSNLLVDNMAKGIGENVCDIVRSLVTDTSWDSIVDIEIMVRYNENQDEHSHYANGAIRNATLVDGRLPSMVTMTFGENLMTDRNFVWFTDKNMMASDFQIVEGDKAEFVSQETSRKLYQGQSETYAVDYPLVDLGIMTTYTTKEVVRHTFSLRDLKQDTIYSYRVGDSQKDRWGEVFTFKTPIEKEKSPFEVLITTDIQGISKSTYQEYAKMLNAAQSTSSFGYDFMVNLGDLVDNGRNANQWKYLLDECKNAYGTIPQVIVSGNHDIGDFELSEGYIPSSDKVVTSGYSPIDLHFNNGGKTYFSYDYKGVHFVVIDTNDIVGDNLNYTQLSWLENDLQQNKDNLVVVSMHKGIYSAGPHRNDNEIVGMRKTLSKLFSDNKVELVLQGHDHVYSESFFLDGEGKRTKTPVYKQGAPINNNNGGVLYVTMGSSGNKFYDFDTDTDDFINKGKMFHSPKLKNSTFGKLVFDGKDIKFYAYQYNIQTDRIEQLKFFSNNSIVLIASISAGIIIVIGTGLLIFFLLRSHKKKIEKCKKDWEGVE